VTDRYAQLHDYAVSASLRYLFNHIYTEQSAQTDFMFHHATLLSDTHERKQHPERDDSLAVYDFLDTFATWQPGWKPDRDLWERLMCEWPMGDYADRLAATLNAQPHGRWIEAGAGVGNVTRQLDNDNLLTTDLNSRFAELAWDFDQPPPDVGRFDIAYACNAIHCATNIDTTLGYLDQLADRIIIAEGLPWTPLQPWCLTGAFGMLDGWWNRGGFRSIAAWTNAARNLKRKRHRTITPIGDEHGRTLGLILDLR
jgi:hypothetical protein